VRLIRQRNGLDCGIAVAAMLAGCPYAAARAADPDPDAMHGFWLPEMIDCLGRITGCRWAVSRRTTLPPGPAAVIIRPAGRHIGHWIAWDGRRIYDPQMRRPFFPERYPRRNWEIVRVVYQPG